MGPSLDGGQALLDFNLFLSMLKMLKRSSRASNSIDDYINSGSRREQTFFFVFITLGTRLE
jgi:hypothetical protein